MQQTEKEKQRGCDSELMFPVNPFSAGRTATATFELILEKRWLSNMDFPQKHKVNTCI